MNRSLFTSLFSLITIFATAQVPNSSFEEWKTTSFGIYNITEPKGWTTQNLLLAFEGKDASVEKTTDAHSGTYAMKLTNTANENNMPAYASVGEVGISSMNDKFPVNRKALALEGFFKYNYQVKDTMVIIVMMFKNGNNIGYGQFETDSATATYTKFTAEIEYFGEETPDSGSIQIFAGSFEELKTGTVLYIDDLALTGTAPTGIAESAKQNFNMHVYPNPARGNATVSFEQIQAGNTSIGIYDLVGNEVQVSTSASFAAGNHEKNIDVSGLAEGMYLVRISQAAGQKTVRILVK